MNELASHFLDIMLRENPRQAAIKIAGIVLASADQIREKRVAEAEAFAELRQILDRFYAYEGRTAGMLEAIQVLDQERGMGRDGISELLTTKAHRYRDEMNHYHVLLKAMQ